MNWGSSPQRQRTLPALKLIQCITPASDVADRGRRRGNKKSTALNGNMLERFLGGQVCSFWLVKLRRGQKTALARQSVGHRLYRLGRRLISQTGLVR